MKSKSVRKKNNGLIMESIVGNEGFIPNSGRREFGAINIIFL